jgi:predicted regulator of Ras-like GTPase activity (Roadblock/LC7/MglB family)
MATPSPRFPETIAGPAAIQLHAFVKNNPTVVLALLTSADGWEIASSSSRQTDMARIAAMTSSMQALADSMAREVALGRNHRLILETEQGAIVVLGVAAVQVQVPMSLTVVAVNNEALGRLLWTTRDLRNRLETALAPGK